MRRLLQLICPARPVLPTAGTNETQKSRRNRCGEAEHSLLGVDQCPHVGPLLSVSHETPFATAKTSSSRSPKSPQCRVRVHVVQLDEGCHRSSWQESNGSDAVAKRNVRVLDDIGPKVWRRSIKEHDPTELTLAFWLIMLSMFSIACFCLTVPLRKDMVRVPSSNAMKNPLKLSRSRKKPMNRLQPLKCRRIAGRLMKPLRFQRCRTKLSPRTHAVSSSSSTVVSAPHSISSRRLPSARRPDAICVGCGSFS